MRGDGQCDRSLRVPFCDPAVCRNQSLSVAATSAAQLHDRSEPGCVRGRSGAGRAANERARILSLPMRLWKYVYAVAAVDCRTSDTARRVFMHERQTETGQCLLLVVSVWRAPKDSRVVSKRDHLIFSMEEFHIANRNSPRYWARDGDRIDLAELDPGGRDGPLRLFGGQVDPNDPTHFTIRYQIGSKEGVIDGYEAEGRLGEYGRKEPGRRLEIRKEKTGSLK